MKKSYMTD